MVPKFEQTSGRDSKADLLFKGGWPALVTPPKSVMGNILPGVQPRGELDMIPTVHEAVRKAGSGHNKY